MKKLLLLLGVAITAGFFALSWYNSSLEPLDELSTTSRPIQVKKGAGVHQIAELLYDQGLIQSPFAFKTYVKMQNLESSLQAGSFILKKSQSVPEMVAILQNGRSEEFAVTIPEGYTVTDIDDLLVKKELIEPGEFIACAVNCDFSEYDFLPDSSDWLERSGQVEGYLYPDTYFVKRDFFDVEQFTKRLLDTFDRKVINGLSEQIGQSDRSLEEIITMATLIEKEARLDEERPMVSGILWKRYDQNAGLGVDATVRYMLNKPTSAITVADLNDNSDYNTRKFRGLPPGPIANAGYESILAAIGPKESEYYYYLHGNDGQIHYAITNQQHNINKFKYIK